VVGANEIAKYVEEVSGCLQRKKKILRCSDIYLFKFGGNESDIFVFYVCWSVQGIDKYDKDAGPKNDVLLCINPQVITKDVGCEVSIYHVISEVILGTFSVPLLACLR
jgi:hypothetical protein